MTPKAMVIELAAASLSRVAAAPNSWKFKGWPAKMSMPEIVALQTEMLNLAQRLRAEIPKDKAPIEGESKEVKE